MAFVISILYSNKSNDKLFQTNFAPGDIFFGFSDLLGDGLIHYEIRMKLK
jgi:hypothetical protein